MSIEEMIYKKRQELYRNTNLRAIYLIVSNYSLSMLKKECPEGFSGGKLDKFMGLEIAVMYRKDGEFIEVGA